MDERETDGPPKTGVNVSCAVTSTGSFPVFTTVMLPCHIALAIELPAEGRLSVISDASSRETTSILLNESWSLVESESPGELSASQEAVI